MEAILLTLEVFFMWLLVRGVSRFDKTGDEKALGLFAHKSSVESAGQPEEKSRA